MSLTKFTESTNIISELDDQPSLTATELKAKFDEVGGKIKTYLNNTLTTETEQLVATEKTALQNSISSLSISTTASINELRTAENAMIGDGYSTTQSYKIGDLCIYNNVLYRCTTAIDEGEAWNSSHWEQTNLGDEVRKPEVYSTDEVDTGKIWVDGKEIYRKTFMGASMPDKQIEIDISSLNIDTIFFITDKSYLCWRNGSGNSRRWAPIIQTCVSHGDGVEPSPPYFQSEVFTNYTHTALTINCGRRMEILDWAITIEYTKTTE